MRISEIQRYSDDEIHFSSETFKLDPDELLPKLTMIPGSDRFAYTFDPTRTFFTKATNQITLFDIKHPTRGIYYVGDLKLRKAAWFPIPKSYEVANVRIDGQYLGRGLGETLYGVGLKLLGMTIVADEGQTAAARKMWVRLSTRPGVEVRGYTSIFNSDWKKRNNPEMITDPDVLDLVNMLKKKKVEPIGSVRDPNNDYAFVYLSFPIGPDDKRNELRALTRKLKIYSADHPEFGGTTNGLYARWVG